jgi:hypothetical protein
VVAIGGAAAALVALLALTLPRLAYRPVHPDLVLQGLATGVPSSMRGLQSLVQEAADGGDDVVEVGDLDAGD